MKGELLLEIFGDEIPYRAQKNAEKAFESIFRKAFTDNSIEFSDLKIFTGPRRITLLANGLPEYTESKNLEIRGPKIGSHEKALEGFCKKENIEKKDLTRSADGYYLYKKTSPRINISSILKEISPIALGEYVWPKSMETEGVKWIRPLRSVLCLFRGAVIDFSFGDLIAGDETKGHFLVSDASIKITNFKDYESKLEENFVILDKEKRKDVILNGLKKAAESAGAFLREDIELLEEVASITEYPKVFLGRIDPKFLRLPEEVLVTSMKNHQRYFSLSDPSGNFAPYFLFASNSPKGDPDLIIKGNEKVLSARLEDALYFYERDLTKPLESYSPDLEKVIFHKDLGNMKEKVERLVSLSSFLAPGDSRLSEAARLCKSDLLSETVAEFPELQGIMGYYYAKAENLSEETASSIKNHYSPSSQLAEIPMGKGAFLALADKIDNLVGLILAGEEATSSKDPYALRRQALGIIRIVIGNGLELNLRELCEYSASLYSKYFSKGLPDKVDYIVSFIGERMKFYLKEDFGVSVINAVLRSEFALDLFGSFKKLESFKNFLPTEKGAIVQALYKRASGILGSREVEKPIDESLLISKAEKDLYVLTLKTESSIFGLLEKGEFDSALILLYEAREKINSFFDHTTIIDEDPRITSNRLALAGKVKSLFDLLADFGKL